MITTGIDNKFFYDDTGHPDCMSLNKKINVLSEKEVITMITTGIDNKFFYDDTKGCKKLN